jgi:hypothetical protein
MPPGTHGAGTVAENRVTSPVEQLHRGLLGRASVAGLWVCLPKPHEPGAMGDQALC